MTAANSLVTLLHTNDIHSHLEETSQIAAYVKMTRRSVPAEQLLVVDCGDFLDRARRETEGTHGVVNKNLLRLMEYDALVPGNNEGLTYTFEQLDAFYTGLFIPVVCANFRPLNPDRHVPWLTPSITVRKSGLQIGLIGLTAPFNDYYELLGWHAADPIETAAAEVSRLRDKADIVIVMSHLGLRQDERLAVSVEGIDLILGAHTHHLLEKPLIFGHTAICAAGKFGTHIGHLELSRDAGRQAMIGVTGGCLPMRGRPSDEEADAVISAGREEARLRMKRVVAVLDEPLPWATDRETPLSVLLAAAVRHKTGAEIGLVNAGQFLDGLPAGEITEEAVHTLCPSPINCCTMRLTGGELTRALEESLLPEYYGLEIRGFGFRGHLLGTICCDGLEADADLSQPPFRRLSNIRINGHPCDPDKEYVVGTLDMFTFGVGYVGLKDGRDVRYLLPDFIRELLCEALADGGMVSECRRPRIAYEGTNPIIEYKRKQE